MKNKSFTLIELLVVIVIIGILSGVLIISTSNFITETRNTKLIAELSNLSKALEGHSRYYQGSFCIEDELNNAEFKSFLGITTVPVHPNYPIGGTALTTNNCFLYFSDGKNYSIRVPAIGNKGYLIHESRYPQVKDIKKTCEPGWIAFGNRCVMKYWAKAKNNTTGSIDTCPSTGCSLSDYIPVSQSSGTVWLYATQPEAKIACESIGAHLITNAEWMAIARDAEQVKSNWSGGDIGLGSLNKPNLSLSNGETIYYIADEAEWVDDIITRGDLYINFNGQTGYFYYNKLQSCGITERNVLNFNGNEKFLPYTMLGPLGSYGVCEGTGTINLDGEQNSDTIYVMRRGDPMNWTYGEGIFGFRYSGHTSRSDSIRFRCVK